MKRKLIGAALVLQVTLITSGVAYAAQTDDVADQLGTILASEKACGLTFDWDAIQAYVVKHVDANDMEFAISLNTSTDGTAAILERSSASYLAAHCAQIRRVAKQNGFIK